MVRTCKRKTNRSAIQEENIIAAVQDVLQGRLSIRTAAITYNLKRSTVGNKVKKKKDNVWKMQMLTYHFHHHSSQCIRLNKFSHLPKKNNQPNILSKVRKWIMVSHIHKLKKWHFIMPKKLNVKHPPSWNNLLSAGKDWMKLFMKRYPILSLRKPENTSMARVSGFNKTNVK